MLLNCSTPELTQVCSRPTGHQQDHPQMCSDSSSHCQQASQQQPLLLKQHQQHFNPQQQHARWSPFGLAATQLASQVDCRALARASAPGHLIPLQEQDSEQSENDAFPLNSMLSSSWNDSSMSMSISRHSLQSSSASMRSFNSSPLQQHLQDLLASPVYQEHHSKQQQQEQRPQQCHQQHVTFAQPPPRAASCTQYSPCCSNSSDFGDLCCCSVLECSSRDGSNLPLAVPHSASGSCSCAARAGSNSSTQSSSDTHCSDGSNCSSSSTTAAHAALSTGAAAAAAAVGSHILGHPAPSAVSTWANKSHHVASRAAPGGDLGTGITWVMPEFGGREVLADYEFGQTLGCGTFGVTRLVTHRKTASLWACKTICKASIAASPAAQSDAQHEVEILQHLRGHNGIVQLKGVYEDERSIHLVMELCTGGDLLDYISRFGRLQEDEAADVASVMLSTLAHCHRLGVVHRDIKPENFLLGAPTLLSAPAGTAANVLKISDFGVSAFHQPGEHFSEIVGTPFYMAPEVLERCYGPAADIWSVGVVVFLMLAGRLPFDGATDRGIFEAVLDSEPDFLHPAWDGISAAAKDCVSRMLVKDPRQRASVQQLLEHQWLAGRMRSSCCSNAGDTAVVPASSCDASAAAAQASQCAASIPHHLQQQGGVACSSSSHPCVDTSSSSSHGSSKAVGVTWASDVTAGSTPRGRRDSSPTPRKPVLSPIKSMRSRAGDF